MNVDELVAEVKAWAEQFQRSFPEKSADDGWVNSGSIQRAVADRFEVSDLMLGIVAAKLRQAMPDHYVIKVVERQDRRGETVRVQWTAEQSVPLLFAAALAMAQSDRAAAMAVTE